MKTLLLFVRPVCVIAKYQVRESFRSRELLPVVSVLLSSRQATVSAVIETFARVWIQGHGLRGTEIVVEIYGAVTKSEYRVIV